MKKNYKKLAVLVAVMILTLSIASSGFAANVVKNLAVTYRNIRVFNNGIQANFSNEPFIVNATGTTYVPLRDMSTLFNKNITWDNATSTITIQDNPGQSINELSQQIFTLQMKVTQLQDENKKLKDQAGNSSMDLDDLEDELNDDYSKIGKVTINEIKLDGKKDDYEVEIYIDTTKTAQYDAWEALDDDDIEEFLQDIVDDILKQFKNADITGFIYDKYDKSKPVKFSISSKDKVVLGSSSSSSNYDLDDLEDYLNDEYYDYYDSDDIYFEIFLDGDEDEVEVVIEAYDEDDDLVDDISDYLTKTEVKTLLNKIYNDILDIDEFEDADVYGYIIDDAGEMDFDYYDGSLNLEW